MPNGSQIKRWVTASYERYIVHSDNKNNGQSADPLWKQDRSKIWVTVRVSVDHTDRDIEHHALWDFCEGLMPEQVTSVGETSLEAMAEGQLRSILTEYPKRDREVHITKGNDCGAVVTYSQHSTSAR